ncbi:hypothetical protein DPMN_010587 [Dreissena polymorpha]|uniref:Uncharacterized protein n=1 Tax=Dreissena polymorpha TaxID=45954 RepID=A0A9D4RZD7_DREPO|nr:hypothetical protein DPMN_010587 [Dreissena polymorpha]
MASNKIAVLFVFSIVATLIHGASVMELHDLVKRGINCDSQCSQGGCRSWEGRCFGECYCYGSGLEYRCRSCDL